MYKARYLQNLMHVLSFLDFKIKSVLFYMQPKNVPQMPLQPSLIMHSFVDLRQTAEPFRSLNYRFEILLRSAYWNLPLNCIAIRDDSFLVRVNVSRKVTREEKIFFFFLSPNLLLFESVLFILLFRISVTFTAYLKIKSLIIRRGQWRSLLWRHDGKEPIEECKRRSKGKWKFIVPRSRRQDDLVRNNSCKCTYNYWKNERENSHEGITWSEMENKVYKLRRSINRIWRNLYRLQGR